MKILALNASFVYTLEGIYYSVLTIIIIARWFMRGESLSLQMFSNMNHYICNSHSGKTECIFFYDKHATVSINLTFVILFVLIVSSMYSIFYAFYYKRDNGYYNSVRYFEHLVFYPISIIIICIITGMREVFVVVLFGLLQFMLEFLMYTQEKMAIQGLSSMTAFLDISGRKILSPFVWTSIPIVFMWISIFYELTRINYNSGFGQTPPIFSITVVLTSLLLFSRKASQGWFIDSIQSKNPKSKGSVENVKYGKIAVADSVYDTYETFNMLFKFFIITLLVLCIVYTSANIKIT